MDDDGDMVFEGFGTSGGSETSQLHLDETIANWANALVDEVFNDSDCERLQVTSIVCAIKEIGFPIEYASKVRLLEQQLDPKNESVTVDKQTLKNVVKLWLKNCNCETDTEESTEVESNISRDVHLNSETRFYDDVHQGDDDTCKNEISGMHITLNAYEDKIKILSRDNDLLKKSVKTLKAALQKAEEDGVLAEESKTRAEETLKIEKCRSSKEINALNNKLKLDEDKLEILVQEMLEYDRKVRDLKDELVIKHNSLEEVTRENDSLKMCLDQLQEQSEKEIAALKSTNLELIEHGNEYKKTIQNLREEKNVLIKKLLMLVSKNTTNQDASNSSPDGSDSSSICETFEFSPALCSSPLINEQLRAELAGTSFHKTVNTVSTSGTPIAETHPPQGMETLLPEHRGMRKRKLFPHPALKLNTNQKRHRSDNSEAISTKFSDCVRGSALATLPLERSTSFAINLTVHQKLLESLRQALYLNPHLFGCIRDFVSCQVGHNNITGTELLHKDLKSLFYEFCTSQLSMPFRGRQFLRVIYEEIPTQSSSSAVQTCHFIELNNDETSENSQASSDSLEFENNSSSQAVQIMYPHAITEGQVLGYDSSNGQYIECSDTLMLPNNMSNLRCVISEVETIPLSANLENEPSSIACDETVLVASLPNVAELKNQSSMSTHVSSFANSSVVRRRCKFMMKFTLFTCFFLICLFFGLIFLAKKVLPEEEYVSLLLALGGKYRRHEPLLY